MSKVYARVSKIADKTWLKHCTEQDILSGVITEVQDYAKELLAYSPGLKFAPKRDNELWVYLEDNPYVLGFIGYGDYLVHVTGEHKYMVASRNIKNEKYASYNEQYRMYTSSNFKTILGKAKKAMRPIHHAEIAKMESRDIQSKFNADISNKECAVDEVLVTVRRSTALLQELRHMLNSEYEFKSLWLKEQTQLYFDNLKLRDEAKAKTLHAYFVRAYDKYGDGELHFNIVGVNNLQNYNPTVEPEVLYCTEQDIPEDILGKVSVLNITEVNEYVEDVGYNTGDGMFYVVKQS